MANNSSNPVVSYRKLTGLHRGVGVMSQLWLADDHVLHVSSTGYTETYRRCYLRDIQSIILVHSGRRLYIALTLAFLLAIISLSVLAADGGIVGFSIVAIIFLPLLVWNHARGPGCRAVIVTAVQQEKVAALSRLPKSRRILAELKPLIDAAQADFLTPLPVASAPEAPATAAVPPPLLPPPLPPA